MAVKLSVSVKPGARQEKVDKLSEAEYVVWLRALARRTSQRGGRRCSPNALPYRSRRCASFAGKRRGKSSLKSPKHFAEIQRRRRQK